MCWLKSSFGTLKCCGFVENSIALNCWGSVCDNRQHHKYHSWINRTLQYDRLFNQHGVVYIRQVAVVCWNQDVWATGWFYDDGRHPKQLTSWRVAVKGQTWCASYRWRRRKNGFYWLLLAVWWCLRPSPWAYRSPSVAFSTSFSPIRSHKPNWPTSVRCYLVCFWLAVWQISDEFTCWTVQVSQSQASVHIHSENCN